MSENGRMGAGSTRCARCGGEMRFRRQPVRGEFRGQWVRVEVESSQCTGCGDLQFHGVAAAPSPRSEARTEARSERGGRQDYRRSENRRS